MKLRGNSGCLVEVIKDYVRKSTEDISYIPRLKRQASKQEYFYKKNKIDSIKTPKIQGIHENDHLFSFDMDFCLAQNCIEFFQQASKYQIDFFFHNILEFLTTEINDSTFGIVDSTILIEKYRKTKENLGDYNKDLFQQIDEKLLNLKESINIPLGSCHGDLTISNILVNCKKSELIFIDFLDTFLESPIQDMVKLRQDTKFCWSLNLYTEKFDKQKLQIIMSYLDEKFHKVFQKYEFYNRYYEIFQILNLVRVLNYTKKEENVKLLENSLLDLLK